MNFGKKEKKDYEFLIERAFSVDFFVL